MRSQASTIEEYLDTLSEDRKEAMQSLRKMIKKNLPKGFIEKMGYGMIGYVVPHSIYPPGYHCTPELPLPFMNIASQKNFIAVYHMGIYGDANLLQWFVDEQVEEESNVGQILNNLKIIKGEGQGLLMMDREMQTRAFVNPFAAKP